MQLSDIVLSPESVLASDSCPVGLRASAAICSSFRTDGVRWLHGCGISRMLPVNSVVRRQVLFRMIPQRKTRSSAYINRRTLSSQDTVQTSSFIHCCFENRRENAPSQSLGCIQPGRCCCCSTGGRAHRERYAHEITSLQLFQY